METIREYAWHERCEAGRKKTLRKEKITNETVKGNEKALLISLLSSERSCQTPLKKHDSLCQKILA